jgi:hypothetical protein
MTSETLAAGLLTVGDIFGDSDTRYTIPIYQRNFAWGAEQIEQVISDVQDAMRDNDGSYFLGNLIVTERGGKGTDFEVIDGQQRLTTLFLLLTFLHGAAMPVPESYRGRLHYQSRPRSADALRRIATSRPEHAGADGATRDEDQGIHQGYNVIRQYMDQNLQAAKGPAFAEYLVKNVTLVRAVLPRKIDLNRYFEIMNTRGQQLQQVDIVKARLMSLLEAGAEQACFAWVWDACTDMDSYVQMSLTRGNTALREVLFGGDWAWLQARSFDELLTAFNNQANGATGNAPDAGVLEALDLEAALHKYASTGTSQPADDVENVRFRSTIEFPTFLLHVLKVWRGADESDEGGLDDKKLIDGFAAEFDRSARDEQTLRGEVREFLLLLLRSRNYFDAFVIKRQFTAANVDEGDWSLQRLVKGKTPPGKKAPSPRYINVGSSLGVETEDDGDVDTATRGLLLVESMLRVTYTSPRTMHWITRVLRSVEADEPQTKIGLLHDILRDYARTQVRAELSKSGEPKQGFGISRIVFTYLDYLLVTEAGDKEFRFSYRNSIEHFYPQSPDVEQSGAQVSTDLLNLFGNLALVSLGANSKFSNSLPRAKAENFRETIELQSKKLQRMAQITRSAGWNDHTVREHHQEMLSTLRRDLWN